MEIPATCPTAVFYQSARHGFRGEAKREGLVWHRIKQERPEELVRQGRRGVGVDQQLKKLIKELGDAISESLTDSEQIADVISRIKAGGYDIFLVLEATIGFNKQDEKPSRRRPTITARTRVPEFKLNSQDMKFLKSMKISADDAA